MLPMSFHQPHLMVADLSAVLRRRGPVAVGSEFPAPRRGIHRRFEDLVEVGGEPRVFHLSQHLDPAVEIAVHHICAADEELVDRVEMENSRMLQEAAENRAHDDIFFGETLGARLEAQMPRTTTSTRTPPACDARYSASMTCSSTRALAFSRIRPLPP